MNESSQRYVAAIAIASAIVMFSSSARAHNVRVNLGDTWESRFLKENCGGDLYAMHFPDGAVPVYLNNSSTHGVQRILKQGGTSGNYTVGEIQRVLEQVLYELNDSAGTNVRFYYATTTQNTFEPNGVVVHVPAGVNGSADPAHIDLDADCLPFKGALHHASIVIHIHNTNGSDKTWSINENAIGQLDLSGTLQHEFGHALGLRDLYFDPPVAWNSVGQPYAPYSIMRATQLYARHFTKYDRESIHWLSGTRSATFREYISGSAQGYGASWVLGDGGVPSGFEATYRMGKLSEGGFYTVMAWVRTLTTTIAGMFQYSSGYEDAITLSPTFTYSPPAIAHAPSSGTYRMYYLEKDPVYFDGPVSYYYLDNMKRICWLESPDGASWSAGDCLVDPSTGQYLKTWTDGVNASYDPYRKLFVATWIDNSYLVRIFSQPASDSTVPAEKYSWVGHYSWETPALACSNAQTGCILAFHSKSLTRYLVTQRGGFDASGVWSNSTSFSSGNDLDQWAPPSLSYQSFNGKFVLAYIKSGMQTLRTYRKTLLDTSWSDGTNAGTTTASFSAPALGHDQFCFFGCADPRSVLAALRYQY